MKLHIAILVLITVIAQTTTEDSSSSSIEHVEDGRLSTSQGWDQSNDPETYREEYEVEPETNKRLRNRGGKRRRRLRQRVRTTERPPDIENSDELHTAASSLEGAENEELAPPPRRRPNGKRRRRPLRRYYENEPPLGRPRRRKGGRKRIRPQVVNIDDLETTTFISLDYDSPTTIKVTSGEIIKTESSTEMSDKSEQIEDKHSNEDVINYRREYSQTNSTTQNKRKAIQVPKDDENENREFNNELAEPLNKEETDQNQRNVDNEFGNKIFERKNLFSNPRRLPETSATLRRRLIPRVKNSTFVNHVRIIKPLANLESELESRELMKNDSITQNIDKPKTNSKLPEVNESHQIPTKIKSKISKEQNFEEPNYPKLELFNRKNKTVVLEELKVSTTTTEDYPITTTEITQEETTQFLEIETKSSTPTNNNNNSILKIPNLDDELFELLNSEAGKNRLHRILEIRNMTLTQLLDHRERGSSTFHLSDIFSKPQANSNEKLQTTKQEVNTKDNVSKDHQKHVETPENLSSDDILSPPPIFENDHNSVPIYDPTKYLNNYNLEKESSVSSNQYRESRIFDSMPEFTTKPPVAAVKSYPTWRIIPNPKLKPVSVRGDYKEIKISNIFPSDKPELENEIDKIFLLEERDNFIEHRNNVAATSRSADHRETPFLFRKIPVSVKSAIAVSAAILVLAIFGFLSVLISCRLRQKKARLRAKQDILCEHLQNDDFMTSQQSLSPVLTKHNSTGAPVFQGGIHPNVASNRHYYLWRTLRKTFQYD